MIPIANIDTTTALISNMKDQNPHTHTINWGMCWLRIFCALQVYGIHYSAGHGLKAYMWIYSLAVPTFLLMSAYLYGLQHTDDKKYGWVFLKKRFYSISCMTYPLLFAIFLYFVFCYPNNTGQYALSLFGEVTYLQEIVSLHLPHMGHLWFLQSLFLCYIALTISTKFPIFQRLFTSPRLLIVLFLIVLGCGFVYRGSNVPYLFFYLYVFYNAKTIRNCKFNGLVLLTLLILHFVIAYIGYVSMFHYGISLVSR